MYLPRPTTCPATHIAKTAFPFLTLLLLLNAAAGTGRAQTLALDFSGGTATTSNADKTLGWSFSVSAPIQVTALGVFDQGNDGLANSHQIAIWNSTGTTYLAIATVGAGTSAPAVVSNGGLGAFRFATLGTSLSLGPGNYLIGALYSNNDADKVFASTSSVTTGGLITYGQAREALGFNLPAPLTVSSGVSNGWFGPNFQYTPVSASAPEPGSFALLLPFVVIGSGMVRRKWHPHRD